jgi:hypothetical protein
MKTPKELAPLLPALQGVQRLIDHFDKKGIIIGGADARANKSQFGPRAY